MVFSLSLFRCKVMQKTLESAMEVSVRTSQESLPTFASGGSSIFSPETHRTLEIVADRKSTSCASRDSKNSPLFSSEIGTAR